MCKHTHTHTSLVPLDSSCTCSTAAIVGGIVGGLVALGIMCLLSSIIMIVAVKLSKQGKYNIIASYKHSPSQVIT